jgi:hypothetical protein
VPVAAGERSPGAGAGVCGEAGRCFCFDGPYRRLRWRRGGSGPPMRTVSPAPVAERRIGSSNADRIAGSGGGEADRVLQCGPYRRLRWRRAGSGPPMRTVSPAPVAESRIGSSYADRIAGSGGGEADRVLQCGPYRRLRWRRGGSGPPMRTVSPAPVAESRIGSSNADRIAGSGGGEADWVLLCGPYRRLRWRRGGSGPPMRTVSPAPVAERRIGSSYADRIAGSGGGEADWVLLCGPYRRLRWRRVGSGPQRRSEPPTLVPEGATGFPSWSASRRGSPLPSWEPGRPDPAAVVDALRSPGRALTSRPAGRGLRGSGRGPQGLASCRALRELLLGGGFGGGAGRCFWLFDG